MVSIVLSFVDNASESVDTLNYIMNLLLTILIIT
jgi:hypothetical protein